jgi:osomolarity two-component system, sensor histidine kinase TcsA
MPSEEIERSIMDDIFDLNPIPSVILDPSLCILKASKSFLKATKFNVEECVGIAWFSLLKDKGLIRDHCARQIRNAIGAATETQSVQPVHQISIGAHYSSLRIVPIFKENVMLYFVLEWHVAATPVTEHYTGMERLPNRLSTNEAFQIAVESAKDYAIFLIDPHGYVVT